MANEKDKMIRAREILHSIIEGKEPFSDEEIKSDSFLNEPRMIRCLSYIVKVLTSNIEEMNRPRSRRYKQEFYITEEELKKVQLPDRNIGINEFCREINAAIETETRKKLTGQVLNKQLKLMGILSEKMAESGRIHTILSDCSHEYGITTERASYNGRVIDKIVYTEKGKQFLMDNLFDILQYERKEPDAKSI